MSRGYQMYIAHPETKKVYIIPEAAVFIGITKAQLYKRIRNGETGMYLWRASDIIPRGDKDPRSSAEQQRLLDAIPSPTKFDLL